MRDFQGLEETTGAVTSGIVAGAVVRAVDRILRHCDLADRDHRALDRGVSFLETFAFPHEFESAVSRSIGGTEGAVMQLLSHGEGPTMTPDLERRIEQLISTLRAAQSDPLGTAEGRRDRLIEIANLFAGLGNMELARANAVSRERSDAVAWMGLATTSRF